MSEGTDTNHHQQRPRLNWLLWTPTLLLLYVLSIGPVARLEHMGVATHTFYERFYKPLERIAANSSLMDHFFNWYEVDVWGTAHSYDHAVPTAFDLF